MGFYGFKEKPEAEQNHLLPLTLLEQLHAQNRIEFKISFVVACYLFSESSVDSWITASYIIDYLNMEIWSIKFTGQQGEW